MSTSPLDTKVTPPAGTGNGSGAKTMKARACDQCHARRIKCAGEGVPCASCSRAGLSCTFIKVPRKKGPKGTVLETLRQTTGGSPIAPPPPPQPQPPPPPQQQQQLQHQPQAGPSGQSNGRQMPQQQLVDGTRATAADAFALNSYMAPVLSPASAHSSDAAVAPHGSLSSFFMGLPSSADVALHSHISPSMPMLPPTRNPALSWLAVVTKAILLPQIDIFYARLHAILPMIPRSYIQSGMDARVELHDPSFASLLLAMTALALVGPVAANEREEDSQPLAAALIDEAMRARGLSTNQMPTMEAIWTTFFLFAAQFNMGRHNEAWCRLREALTLAETLELHKQTSYDHLPIEECSRRIRTLWVLMVTERAYAMQRNHSIIFTARLGVGWALGDLPWLQAEPHDVVAMLGLRCLAHLYSFINEDIISCWNGKCLEGVCETLDGPQVVALQRGLGGWAEGFTESSMSQLSEANRADLLISQQWLRNRIWQLTVSHCLSGDHAPEPELRPSFSLEIAQETVRVCRLFKPAALEANGVGVAHKIHDIVLSIIYANRILSDQHAEAWMRAPPLVLGQQLRAELTSLLQTFRGGRHPFLKPVMEML